MKLVKVYNVVIDHHYQPLGISEPSQATLVSCDTREEAERVLAEALLDHTGPAELFRGSIDECYIAETYRTQERKRLQWWAADSRAVREEFESKTGRFAHLADRKPGEPYLLTPPEA